MRALVRGMALAAVVIALAPAPANATSAMQMASNCNPLEGEMKLDGDKMYFSGKPHIEIGHCLGFFEAIQAATSVQWEGQKHTALYICAPPKTWLSQFVLVFQKYVREKPETAHKDAFDIALTALREAFPCKD